MDAVALIKHAAERHAWESVPELVVEGYKQASDVARLVRTLSDGLPHRKDSRIYWDRKSKTLNLSLPDKADAAAENAWSNRLQNIRGVDNVWIDREWVPRDNVEIKLAAAPLQWLSTTRNALGSPMGGPNPLVDAILGSLLLGGAGYGTGAAVEALLPDRFEEGRLRKTLGIGGAVAGALPGVYKGNLYGRVDGTNTLQGMITPDDAPIKAAALLQGVPIPPQLTKLAENLLGLGAGGTGIPSIPVDAFNRMIWRDARKGVMSAEANPYGTKSPWGDNSQTMHTPPPVAAATTGILSGVSQMVGSPTIGVGDIVRGIAGAGIGLGAATLAGKTLGALGGLSTNTQEQLQNAGIFAGVLTAVIPPLFGR